MKFNKAFLFATLIASSVALTACNDKEAPAQKPAEAQQAAAPAANNALDQFNKSVKITAVDRKLGKNQEGKDVATVIYEVENTGDKPISAVRWASVYTLGNSTNALYLVDVKALFAKPIAPKAKDVVIETTTIESIPEQARAVVNDAKSDIKVTVGAFELDFADGSKIVVSQ